MSSRQKQRDQLAASLEKHFGKNAIASGKMSRALNVIPTGSLTLDYTLGTGGWPRGYMSGIFGPRDIGKSSIIGLNAIASAQRLGLNAAIIAVEPMGGEGWETWAEKHGVNVEELLIAYPDSGEEAFSMMYRIVESGVVDLVIFDSLGAILGESEIGEDAKPRQGGQAGLITWGCKLVNPLIWKNNVAVLMLNQVRDNMSSRIPGVVQQPGGHALEHFEPIIVQLKRGKDRYTLKVEGDDVQIGQSIVAHVLRNKLREGTGHKALFDYYNMETDEYPFGIDLVTDVISIGKRTQVIKQAGAYYDLPNGKRLQGQKAVAEYLDQNPDVLEVVRDQVLTAMIASTKRTELRAVEPEETEAA